jgi:putative colanic acid biosynthesis UDP-glucose lipid carrier transferase
MTRDVPYPLAKRVEDKAIAAALLVILAPVLLAILVLLALGALRRPRDRGPVLYRERRISRGREFDLLKFRVLQEEALAGAAGHARLLEQDTDNLTWAGRLLKRWYLDELPQLWNVIRGDMSLVGPRPWPPVMVADQLRRGHDYRLHVRAGWTGPAQVTKGSPDPVQYAALDLRYVEALRALAGSRVVLLDLRLLAESLRTLARGQGLRF